MKSRERTASTQCSNTDSDTDLSFLDCSQDTLPTQIMPGQQFFQDMDGELHNLTRIEYVKKLSGICNADTSRISIYRDHLWSRASTVAGCPQGRLIARKGSNRRSKSEKLSNDCYIIHSFIQGERSGEIFDIISATSMLNDSIVINLDNVEGSSNNDSSKPDNAYKQPDVIAILLGLQADIDQLKRTE